MPGEKGVSSEGVAALPEPAVGVEYPSGEAAKVAVFRAFLAQQAEPACRGNWHKHRIACRLHTDATPSSLGKGSCCTFVYKYEALELGEDPVEITVANWSTHLDLGQNYVRMKLFAAELRYQSQQKERPGEVKPAPGTEAAIDAANPSTTSSQVDKAREPKPIATETAFNKEPEPSRATLDKDAELVAADAAETGNLSTSSAPPVDKPGESASVEPGVSTTTMAATETVGTLPPWADSVPLRAATLLPPPVQASEAGPSLPASAAAAQPAALSSNSKHVKHPGLRSSEDPPPYSVQPAAVEDEPPRKRERLAPPTGFTSGVSDEDGALLGLMDATRTTGGAGSSLGASQARQETNLTSINHSPNGADTKRQKDPQAGTSDAFSDGSSKSARETPLSQGIPLGPIRSFRRIAVQVHHQRQQQVMQPPAPPPPPSMTAFPAAQGFDDQQRPAVELALREIGIRSIRDLATFVLLEDEAVEAIGRSLGTFHVPWAGNPLFPSLELAVGSLLAQIPADTQAIRWT